MTRDDRNKQYLTKPPEKIPLLIILRDLFLTVLAWGFVVLFCGELLVEIFWAIVFELDTDPINDADWNFLLKQLKVSLVFSGSVLAFIGAWTISNLLLLARTKMNKGKQTKPLPLSREIEAYGVTEEEVLLWREQRILTVSIDDKGHILHAKNNSN